MSRSHNPNRFRPTLAECEDRSMPGDAYWALGTLPFWEDWSSIGRITQDNDWTFIPAIMGYSGTGLASGPGTDPRTLTADTQQTAQVKANQINPAQAGNTFGVAEFEGGNPTIALRADATSAPSLVFRFDTTGVGGINFTFNLRDLDAVNDAVTQVGVQFRVGESGNWINAPGGYVADATVPGAGLITPVNVALPEAANNQGQLQVRIITTSSSAQGE